MSFMTARVAPEKAEATPLCPAVIPDLEYKRSLTWQG